MPIGEGVRGRDIAFEVHPTRLRLAAGDEVLLEGDFSGHKVELAGVGCIAGISNMHLALLLLSNSIQRRLTGCP